MIHLNLPEVGTNLYLIGNKIVLYIIYERSVCLPYLFISLDRTIVSTLYIPRILICSCRKFVYYDSVSETVNFKSVQVYITTVMFAGF